MLLRKSIVVQLWLATRLQEFGTDNSHTYAGYTKGENRLKEEEEELEEGGDLQD